MEPNPQSIKYRGVKLKKKSIKRIKKTKQIAIKIIINKYEVKIK
jgi:hypothetical protein